MLLMDEFGGQRATNCLVCAERGFEWHASPLSQAPVLKADLMTIWIRKETDDGSHSCLSFSPLHPRFLFSFVCFFMTFIC